MNRKLTCLHESKNFGWNVFVSDFHQLSHYDVVSLLSDTRQILRDLEVNADAKAQELNDIQDRLVQGIAGITCPPQVHGPVGKKRNDLVDLYREFCLSQLVPDVMDERLAETVNEFLEIMQGE